MAGRGWDPGTYAQFAALRSRPFWDLAALIDTGRPIETMVDLGCGSGELTVALADRLDVADTLGVDASANMLAAATPHARSDRRFESGDIATWVSPTPVDLIVANASLQWVPDHELVIERWLDSLRPGGQIAIQVPANADHPSHTCSAAVAAREPFVSAMGGTAPPDPVAVNVLPPEHYATLLYDLGVHEPHVRLQVYPQVMESSAAVVDWTSGTSLTRFFNVLPEVLHEPFVAAYRAELLAAIGDVRPYFFAFKRILMAGRLTD
jgi:trans-aconitate 2-methyltransferase